MDYDRLCAVHGAILRQRQQCRTKCRHLIICVRSAAERVAARFDRGEMHLLLLSHNRLPWLNLVGVEVENASTNATAADNEGAYSQTLASALTDLAFDRPDEHLRIGGAPRARTQAKLSRLAAKVRVLPADEAVALEVLLESARTVPLAVYSYNNWYQPPMLLRLLESPQFDRPHP